MERIPDKLDKYILDHIDEEPEHLRELNRDTYANVLYPRMLSGHLQGRILKILCNMIHPVKILEIGTFTGYSALCMAEALPKNGSIDTIEINDELESFILKHLRNSPYADKINLIIGDALEILPDLNKAYDLIFIDGNKRHYCAYFDYAIKLVKPGAFIIADNVLWSGKVIEPHEPKDDQTEGIKAFNKILAENKNVEKVIFPVRDGFTVIRKK